MKIHFRVFYPLNINGRMNFLAGLKVRPYYFFIRQLCRNLVLSVRRFREEKVCQYNHRTKIFFYKVSLIIISLMVGTGRKTKK